MTMQEKMNAVDAFKEKYSDAIESAKEKSPLWVFMSLEKARIDFNQKFNNRFELLCDAIDIISNILDAELAIAEAYCDCEHFTGLHWL